MRDTFTHPLTLFTAHRASEIDWSAEARAFFAGMERLGRAFPSSKPSRFTGADIRAAVAREDARPSPYPIGSALHAADWQHNVKVAAGWEAWSRKVEAKIARARQEPAPKSTNERKAACHGVDPNAEPVAA